MGIGTGIFLLAVGAILRYAVTVTTQGVNLHVVGDILMVVGVIGILLSLVFWGSWGGFGGLGGRRRDTLVDRRTVVDREPTYRRTVVEQHDADVY
ncbi:MAG: hypothetical protein QOF30_2521 [Acidimicrobiaceae bacterium]|jgi:hypothetical protein|nr:hypothetical protein [Acidimicrobiaceae bacterium]